MTKSTNPLSDFSPYDLTQFLGLRDDPNAKIMNPDDGNLLIGTNKRMGLSIKTDQPAVFKNAVVLGVLKISPKGTADQCPKNPTVIFNNIIIIGKVSAKRSVSVTCNRMINYPNPETFFKDVEQVIFERHFYLAVSK